MCDPVLIPEDLVPPGFDPKNKNIENGSTFPLELGAHLHSPHIHLELQQQLAVMEYFKAMFVHRPQGQQQQQQQQQQTTTTAAAAGPPPAPTPTPTTPTAPTLTTTSTTPSPSPAPKQERSNPNERKSRGGKVRRRRSRQHAIGEVVTKTADEAELQKKSSPTKHSKSSEEERDKKPAPSDPPKKTSEKEKEKKPVTEEVKKEQKQEQGKKEKKEKKIKRPAKKSKDAEEQSTDFEKVAAPNRPAVAGKRKQKSAAERVVERQPKKDGGQLPLDPTIESPPKSPGQNKA